MLAATLRVRMPAALTVLEHESASERLRAVNTDCELVALLYIQPQAEVGRSRQDDRLGLPAEGDGLGKAQQSYATET